MKTAYIYLKRALAVCAALTTMLYAQALGWPAQYEGVMLQGFCWDVWNYIPEVTTGDNNAWADGHATDFGNFWSYLTDNATTGKEYGNYFNLIWVPNSAQPASNPGNGYDPVYWFYHSTRAFGSEADLRSMIQTYKTATGTGFIEDVVINHRSGVSNWTDFPAETYNGVTYQLHPSDICNTDEVKDQAGQAKPIGNADTGDDFGGSRDLDHTSENVQNNVKAYLNHLLNDVGYAGFRYDMVKGYHPYYTKMYNEAAQPEFSVGEFWDSYDGIAWWINGTEKTSAAFDFALKYKLNEAFKNNKMGELCWKYLGVDQPAGLIHNPELRQWAVTFVDNHDTYRDGSKFTASNYVEAANAFILAMPGTPCVFLNHYLEHTAAIQAMIDARRTAGIHNQSAVEVTHVADSYFVAKVYGKRGTLMIKVGSAYSVDGLDTTGFNLACSGEGYAIWTTNKVDNEYTGPEAPEPEPVTAATVYVQFDATGVSKNDNSSVYAYIWNTQTNNNDAAWPGNAMTKTANGTIYEYQVPENFKGDYMKVIFSWYENSDLKQTGDNTLYPYTMCYRYDPSGWYNSGNNVWKVKPTAYMPSDGYHAEIYYDNREIAFGKPTGAHQYPREDWGDNIVYAYFYKGTKNNGWPGVPMYYVPKLRHDQSMGFWRVQIPMDYKDGYVIFNNGKKGNDEVKTQAYKISSTAGHNTFFYKNGTEKWVSMDATHTQMYILGNVNGNQYTGDGGDAPQAVEMTSNDDGTFSARVVVTPADQVGPTEAKRRSAVRRTWATGEDLDGKEVDINNEEYGYISFAAESGLTYDQMLHYGIIRYGAPVDNLMVDATTTIPVRLSNNKETHSWAVPVGENLITFDPETQIVSLTVPVDANPTELDDITVTPEDNVPVFFSLQGQRLANPAPGQIVIRVRGKVVDKIIF